MSGNTQCNIITSASLIKNIVKRWIRVYNMLGHGHQTTDNLNNLKSGWLSCKYGNAEDIYQKLKALDLDNVDHSVIDQIIGTDTWTRPRCDVCDKYQDIVVAFDIEDQKICVCSACLLEISKQISEPATSNIITRDNVAPLIFDKTADNALGSFYFKCTCGHTNQLTKKIDGKKILNFHMSETNPNDFYLQCTLCKRRFKPYMEEIQ